MSDLNSKLNALVLVAVVIGGCWILLNPQKTEPPDDQWFQKTVVEQPGLVVVKFGAEWCGPCRMLDPELTRLAASLGGRGSVVRVNVDQHRDLARHYGVSSIPRLIVFHHGQVVGDRVGYANHDQLSAWVNSLGVPAEQPSAPPGPALVSNPYAAGPVRQSSRPKSLSQGETGERRTP